MSFYTERIVPWLIHWSMANREATRLRRLVVPRARGRVLEIGIGSGHNLAHYAMGARSVIGVDPSAVLLAMAAKAAAQAPVAVGLLRGSAEAIPFDARTFDTVLTTWTLCSIPDASMALREMRRVLKPDGTLVFIEHGRAADAGVARWQERLNPLWRRCAGGCNINRDIPGLICAAGFAFERLESGYFVKGPRLLTYQFEGLARPA